MRRRPLRLVYLAFAVATFTTGVAAAGNGTPPGQQPPVSSAPPAISGTPQQGQTLTASAGSWSGNALSYKYQWLRCDLSGGTCALLTGQTASSHLVSVAEVGFTLRVAVTASNKNGTASSTSAATAVVAPAPSPSPGGSAPTSTAAPVISGTPTGGQTLNTTSGTWSGSTMSYSYKWLRCDSAGSACAAIANATTASYLLTSSDVGATLRSQVIATNSYGTATATSSQTAVVAAPAPTPAPAPAPSSNSSRFGIATGGGLPSLSSTDLGRYMAGAAAAHVGWVRYDINWANVQAGGPSSYNWGPFDQIANAAISRGIKVLALITYTPAWARPGGTTMFYPPTNLNDYANFCAAAAQHLGQLGVHAYEIWNEPNITFWAPSPDPVRYTAMLKLAYASIKRVDPSAFVVSGGLAPYGAYGQSDAQHINPLNFLQTMYANGAAGNFDGLGWHPYAFPYGITFHTWSAWSQMSETSPSARSLMTANGDSSKQIWTTEFGEPTGSSTRAVSETAQAQYVTDSYAALRAWSWAGPGFLYSYHDIGTNLSDVESNFGIIRYDWALKPSYTAYQAAAAAG
jgi:polysaccharide biosynthesis protein PslG